MLTNELRAKVEGAITEPLALPAELEAHIDSCHNIIATNPRDVKRFFLSLAKYWFASEVRKPERARRTSFFIPKRRKEGERAGRKLRYLGPTERETIERLHKGWATASLIAERIGTAPATVCRELKLGQLTDEQGKAVKDEFGRLIYSAERGQRAFEAAMKRRGRRGFGQ